VAVKSNAAVSCEVITVDLGGGRRLWRQRQDP